MKELRGADDLWPEVLALLRRAPLVTVEADGYFVFHDPGHPGFIYDFKPADALDALSWVRHMAEKNWVTTDHLEQFASLAIQQLAGGNRGDSQS